LIISSLQVFTAVFILVDHSRDVAYKVPTRFWLWWYSSWIWKALYGWTTRAYYQSIFS